MMVPVSALVRIRCWCCRCCCCTISGAALSLADTVLAVVAVATTEARMAVKACMLFIVAVTSRPTTRLYYLSESIQPKLWLLVYSNDESVVIVGLGLINNNIVGSSKEERVSDFGVSLGSGTNQEINYFVCNKGSKFDWRPNGCIPLCAWARLDLYKSTGLYPNGVVKYIQLSSNGDLFIPI